MNAPRPYPTNDIQRHTRRAYEALNAARASSLRAATPAGATPSKAERATTTHDPRRDEFLGLDFGERT